jgi:rsbT co-antagonist protein RsbR
MSEAPGFAGDAPFRTTTAGGDRLKDAESTDDELTRLRLRVAELEQEVRETRRELEHVKHKFSLLTTVTQEAVVVIEEGAIVETNEEFLRLMGHGTQAPAADFLVDALLYVAPESREIVGNNIRTGFVEPYEAFLLRRDGSKFLARLRGRSVEYEGCMLRVTVIRNVTEERRLQETERAAALQAEMIRAQEVMLAQLSTPILPISERIVVMPLIGEVNAARAAQVIETLTQGVFAQQAAIAILDITGTTAVGAEVADMLVRAARAVALLGAQVILTGVRPEVAQAFVMLESDLVGIITRGTLQQGVAVALSGTTC